MLKKIAGDVAAVAFVAFCLGYVGYAIFLWLCDPRAWAVLSFLAFTALCIYLIYFWAEDTWQIWAAYLIAGLTPGIVYFVHEWYF